MAARLGRGVAFALICLAWSSTWLAIKVGYGSLGPLNAAAVRFVAAGAILSGAAAVLRLGLPRRRDLPLVLSLAVLWFFVAYGLVYWAELHIDSGTTAALFATMPIFTSLSAAVLLPGERLDPWRLIGAAGGLAGVVVMLGDQVALRGRLVPSGAVVAAAALAGTCSVLVKRYGTHLNPIGLNGPALLAGGLLLAAGAAARGEGLALPAEPGSLWAVGYLVVVGTLPTFALYAWLLRVWSATSLSFLTILTPVLAIVLGVLALREPITPRMAAGLVLVLASIRLAGRGAGRQAFRDVPLATIRVVDSAEPIRHLHNAARLAVPEATGVREWPEVPRKRRSAT